MSSSTSTTPALHAPAELQQLVKKLIGDKTKASKDSVALTAAILELLIQEGLKRSAQQARAEDASELVPSQLEKILPQLLLDI
ncbi:hypothetical protein BJ742DRAFT_770914 [Cladochytrium replicatum]|nr:hypothetical protein BJ742DRAFT_770914 [Cladochytrium replicatum]